MSKRWLGGFHRCISYPPIRAVLGFFWVGGAIGLGSATIALLPPDMPGVAPLLLAAGALIGYWTFVRIVERRPVAELSWRGGTAELLAGAAIGAALFAVVIGTLFVLGIYSVDSVNAVSVAGPALTAAVMAGVTEELLIRAVAFRILEGWLGSWIALGVSAVLFGLMHLPNPEATVVSAAAISLEAGVLLAAAYMVTRRVWLAIGVHVAWNFTQSGIFGVAVSGMESKGVLNGKLQGPPILSGGTFGAEASIVAVAVCVAAGLLLLRVARRRGHVLAPSWRPAPAPHLAAPAQ